MRIFLQIVLVSGMLLPGSLFSAQWSDRATWQLVQVQSRASGSYIGVGLTDIDADRASALKLGEARGVEVQRVQENSPAEIAGIKAGDVLLTYNGEEILSAPQVGRLVSETPAGRRVKVQYWRNGKTAYTTVVPVSYQERSGDVLSPLTDMQALNVPNIPRMLMLWENLALGIECEPIDSQLAEYFGVHSGILIREVAKNMAGDKAGLRAGDVITSVDTRNVGGPRDLISYLRTRHQPGKTLSISIVRDHRPRTLSVTFGE
ncbi:MAG: PDZ domain-containing protein [Acidobacteriaceae bacterium]|nr:PDZ domain-containing protein [Acidobacteriaceae bacterium]